MISVPAIFQSLAPIAAMVALGWIFRVKNWVGEEVQGALVRLVVWIFTPAIIVDRVMFNPLVSDWQSAGTILLAGTLSIALGVLLSFAAARTLKIVSRERANVFGYTNGIYNYGYIALPICATLCPPDTLGVMLLFNTGIEVGIWTIGISVLVGAVRPKQILKAFLNPIFIATAVTLLLKFSGLNECVPAWICHGNVDLAGTAGTDFAGTPILPAGTPSLANSLGACMIPVGLILVGLSLPSLFRGFSWRGDLAASAGTIILRLMILPALMLAAAIFVPAIPPELRSILIIQSAMPPAMLPIVIVKFYGFDAKLSLRIVLVGTLASLITIPFWIRLGFWLLAHF